MSEDSIPFKRTHLVIVFIVVGLITGGNIWLSRGDTPQGYNRFEEYGISIDYKQDMSLEIFQLDGRPLGESACIIQASCIEGDSVEQFGVIWLKTDQFPTGFDSTPEGFNDYIFDKRARITYRERLKTFEKGGVEIVMDVFKVGVVGSEVPGVIGSWYCSETDRFIQLYLFHQSDLNNPVTDFDKLENIWSQYFKSLNCH